MDAIIAGELINGLNYIKREALTTKNIKNIVACADECLEIIDKAFEAEGEKNNDDMSIVIEDVNLVDDATATGGKANASETLAQFIADVNVDTFNGCDTTTLNDINEQLVACGIEPITLDQIVVKAVEA